MGIIRIRDSNPPGVRAVTEERVICSCGWYDKTGPLFIGGKELANDHNLRQHGAKYAIIDERGIPVSEK